MEKTIYRGQHEVRIYEMEHIIASGNEDMFEKRMILEFFKDLPIEKLKELVNFEKNHPYSMDINTPKQHELQYFLMDKGVVRFDLEIRL